MNVPTATMVRPQTSLSGFADQHLGAPESHHSFNTVTPEAAAKLRDLLGPKAAVEPLLATLFWQIVQAAPGYEDMRRLLGVSSDPMAASETILVARGLEGRARYDLVILDCGIGKAPVKQILNPGALNLVEGQRAWQALRLLELDRAGGMLDLSAQQRYHQLIRAIPADFAVEAAGKLSFSLLAAPLPPTEYTSLPARYWGVAPSLGTTVTSTMVERSDGGLELVERVAPRSPLGTTVTSTAGAVVRYAGDFVMGFACETTVTSTAGAVVRDAKGRPGVTAALHGINGKTSALCIGNAVEVDGKAGTVRDADLVSDSCFIEIDPLPGPHRTTAGPLRGVSPRQYETVSFTGPKSASAKAVVQGWSPDIPLVMSNNQLKVFTDNVANPGDSGAALLDSNGQILGFCFYRSNTAPPYYSAWMWADSVFTALKLTAL
jgi:hypothetical protein